MRRETFNPSVMRAFAIPLIVATCVGASSAGAQSLPLAHRAVRPASGTLQPDARPDRTHVFAINPLGIPFEVVSIEYEQAVQGAFSIAGNFSYFSPSDYSRSSFELKGRLYPNEEAPGGFSVGLGLGAVNTRERHDLPDDNALVEKTHASLGVYADYNWLLGRGGRFYVGAGVGAKRILGDADVFNDAPFVYGTARFVVGVAF